MTSSSRQHRRTTHALMRRPPRPRCRGRPNWTTFTTWLVGCLWIAGTLAAAWPRDAHASQPEVFAGVPVAQDGQGIKVGKRSTFHPGAALSVGYDSNVFSRGQGQEAQGSNRSRPDGEPRATAGAGGLGWAQGSAYFGSEAANGIDELGFLPEAALEPELLSWRAMVVPVLSTTGINTKAHAARPTAQMPNVRV